MFKRFKKKAVNEIFSPVNGEVIAIEQVSDPVFSSKSMGDGFAVIPKDSSIYSPIKGKVVSVFPTKHAFGLIDDEGIEVLVHIGIDTVSLNGQGFSILVNEGDLVTSDTQLAKVDFDYLKQEQKETTTMVIFTNLDNKELEVKTGIANAKTTVGKIK